MFACFLKVVRTCLFKVITCRLPLNLLSQKANTSKFTLAWTDGVNFVPMKNNGPFRSVCFKSTPYIQNGRCWKHDYLGPWCYCLLHPPLCRIVRYFSEIYCPSGPSKCVSRNLVHMKSSLECLAVGGGEMIIFFLRELNTPTIYT